MADVSNPKVIAKKKQIPQLVEFCLDEAIEFSVRQQTFPDLDWEFEMKIKDFKTAVLLGMFLRENRLELEGIEQQRYKRASKKADEKNESASKAEPAPKEEKVKQEKQQSLIPPAEPTLM